MQSLEFQINQQIELTELSKKGTTMAEEMRVPIRVDVGHLTEAITSGALRALAAQQAQSGDVNNPYESILLRFGGRLDLVVQRAPQVPQVGGAISSSGQE